VPSSGNLATFFTLIDLMIWADTVQPEYRQTENKQWPGHGRHYADDDEGHGQIQITSLQRQASRQRVGRSCYGSFLNCRQQLCIRHG